MKRVPGITITDAILTSSSVPDPVFVPHVHASGTITVSAVVHVHATGTITVSGTPVLNETFRVGSQTFIFKAARTGAGEVAINATPGTQATNIRNAINTDIPAEVSAAVDSAIVTITAVSEDATVGNAIVLTESATGIAVSGSGTLSGGVSQAPAINDTFVVDEQTFTIKAAGTATGDVIWNGTSATLAANIKTSLDRDIPSTVLSTSRTDNVLTITAAYEGTEGNSIVLTENATGIAVSGTGTLAGGVNEVAGNVEYNSGTTYAADDVVVITATHTLYKSLQAGNVGHAPATSPTWWESQGKTNRWKMYDAMVTSQTSQADTFNVVLTPGESINSVGVLNSHNTSVRFLMHDGVGGDVYDQTVNNTKSYAVNVVKTDLPSYPAATLTVTITNTNGNATCGWLVIGTYQDLGITQRNPIVRLIDYSTKTVDDYGNYTVTEGNYSRQIECEILTPIADLGTLRRIRKQALASPALWIASDLYSILILYGFAQEFKIETPNNVKVESNLIIEGLI